MKCPRCNQGEREVIHEGIVGIDLGDFMIQDYANETYITCGKCGYNAHHIKFENNKEVYNEDN